MVALGWLVNPVPSSSAAFGTLLYLGIGTQIAALRPIPWRGASHQSVIDPLLIATGLYFPGGGVGVVSWVAVFDGRVPGRPITWGDFLFNRVIPTIPPATPSPPAPSPLENTPCSRPCSHLLTYTPSA